MQFFERYPFVRQGGGNCFQKDRCSARAEAAHHLITSRQGLLGSIQLPEEIPLAAEGCGDRFLQRRGLACPVATDHFVIGRQGLRRPLQFTEYFSLFDQLPSSYLCGGVYISATLVRLMGSRCCSSPLRLRPVRW